ncbi:type II toxin-antitoxin system VapB family antitoxin [Pedobacter sp. 22163]|uniref:type II toxin-antitoxin system VapB family antitoxin n=1 Tax=Pedobacter sp. 22163 TaxID=3453883 RepID=UPI003F84A7A7
MTTATKNIINKLETLPESMVNEVEDFIDFLKAKHLKSFPKSASEKTNIVEEPKSLYGAAKGLFIIPKDFNDPIDDLKDYM